MVRQPVDPATCDPDLRERIIMQKNWTGLAGVSERPGAVMLADGVNFSVYSAHADQIDLCLFDDNDHEQRLPMQRHPSGFWTLLVPDLPPLSRYGFRAHGAWDPVRGFYFNPAKLLIDPYARLIESPLRIQDEHFGYDRPTGNLFQPSHSDSAPVTPKCLVCHYPEDDGVPLSSAKADVIYEAHIMGLTKQHPAVPATQKGKVAGLKSAEVIKHLKSIGVDTLELMPMHAFASEPRLTEIGLENYWGYNSIGFFAPHPGYLGDPTDLGEVRRTVEHMHRAGISVVLDVVCNHTAEGDAWGPLLSLKGLDAPSYFALDPQDGTRFSNHTGCGNTIDFSSPIVQEMALDSLRYWRKAFGIDGFRFDLAPIMMRTGAHEMNTSFCERIMNDQDLRGALLFAEPWDIGPDGYKLGAFPNGWHEWNDQYRDGLRHFWLHDGPADTAITRIFGSNDIFGNRATGTVNFLACHDGFTLFDTLCFNARHNLANGENNNDGHSHNLSNNFGYEGVEAGPEITQVRLDRLRAMLATLFVSQGPIMMAAGDELLRTQNGNNNAYCQNNLLSWLDWEQNQDKDATLKFVQDLSKFRSALPKAAPEVEWPDQTNPRVFCLNWESGQTAVFNASSTPWPLPAEIAREWLHQSSSTGPAPTKEVPPMSVALFSGHAAFADQD